MGRNVFMTLSTYSLPETHKQNVTAAQTERHDSLISSVWSRISVFHGLTVDEEDLFLLT